MVAHSYSANPVHEYWHYLSLSHAVLTDAQSSMGDMELTSPERQKKAKLSEQQFVKEPLSQEDSAEATCERNSAKKQCFSPLKPPNKSWFYSSRKPLNKGRSPKKTIKLKDVVIGLKDVDENANEGKPDVSSIRLKKNMNDGDEESECSQQAWQDESSQDSTQSGEHTDPNKPVRKNGAKCPECGFVSPSQGELHKHMWKHTPDKPYACPIPGCAFRTRYPNNIRHHLTSHRDDRLFPCDLCELKFKTKGCRTTHMLVHTRTKTERLSALKKYPPAECDICQKQFKNKMYLKKHQRLHEGHYPYSCEVCGMKFSTTGNKRSHMAVHSGEGRPYKCLMCPYAGKREVDLRAHIGVMHRQERIYRCDVCLIGFAKQQGLRRHYNTSKHKSNLDKLVVSQNKVDVVIQTEREDEKCRATEEGRGNEANNSQNGTVSYTLAGDVKVEVKQEKEFEEMWGQQTNTPDSPLQPAPKPIEIAPLPSNEAQEEDMDVKSTDYLNNTTVIKPIGTQTLNVSDNLVIKSEKLDTDITRWVATSNTTAGGHTASLIPLTKPEHAW